MRGRAWIGLAAVAVLACGVLVVTMSSPTPTTPPKRKLSDYNLQAITIPGHVDELRGTLHQCTMEEWHAAPYEGPPKHPVNSRPDG